MAQAKDSTPGEALALCPFTLPVNKDPKKTVISCRTPGVEARG